MVHCTCACTLAALGLVGTRVTGYLFKYTYSTSTLKAVSLRVDARPLELPHGRLLSNTTTEILYWTIVVALRPGILCTERLVAKVHKYPERLDCASSSAADNGNTNASGGRSISHSLFYVTLTVGDR